MNADTPSLGHMANYKSTHIFNDATKKIVGAPAVAAAFFGEDVNWVHAERLKDTASIYAAELHAVKLAVDRRLKRRGNASDRLHRLAQRHPVASVAQLLKSAVQPPRTALLDRHAGPAPHLRVDTKPHGRFRQRNGGYARQARNRSRCNRHTAAAGDQGGVR